MNLPNDNIILLSLINTKLRDYYSSLEDLCLSENIDAEELKKRLSSVGYIYKKERNQFV